MSNEFTVTSQITLANGNLNYRNQNGGFRANQTTCNGPSPGSLAVPTSGLNVSLAELTLPGIVQVTNLDPTNYVSVGLYDGTTFRPFMEVLPGETWQFRLSRTVLTANSAADVVRCVANTATVFIDFNCFDS